MAKFNDKQNETFGKLFGEIKRQVNPTFRSQALAVLKLNDENFKKIYTDPVNEIVGDDEDVELCRMRAYHLGIINS